MDKDAAEWVKMAEDNLATAKILSQNDKFKDAAYYSQQVAEKALKAVQIVKLKRFDKLHDLQELAESVKAPGEVSTCAKSLTRYYISARYPLVEEHAVSEEDVGKAIADAEKVLEWAKQILK